MASVECSLPHTQVLQPPHWIPEYHRPVGSFPGSVRVLLDPVEMRFVRKECFFDSVKVDYFVRDPLDHKLDVPDLQLFQILGSIPVGYTCLRTFLAFLLTFFGLSAFGSIEVPHISLASNFVTWSHRKHILTNHQSHFTSQSLACNISLHTFIHITSIFHMVKHACIYHINMTC